MSKGWNDPKINSKEKAASSNITVGDYLSAWIKAPAVKRRTAGDYQKRVVQIISEVMGVNRPKKYANTPKILESWRKRIYGIKLEQITDQKFESWREKCRQGLERNEDIGTVKTRKSTSTVNSMIRSYKAVFSRKNRKRFGHLNLPEKIAGLELSLLKTQNTRYRSAFDAQTLLATARTELKEDHPETYKMLLLCLVCGLRRTEADLLLWTSIDFETQCIRVEPSEHYQLKSSSSAGDVAMPTDMSDFFQKQFILRKSEFVLEAKKPPVRHLSMHTYFRADKTHKHLMAWLKKQGVTDPKPIHALRKEYGSQINKQFGIYAASRALRHSTVVVTESHYVSLSERHVAEFKL